MLFRSQRLVDVGNTPEMAVPLLSERITQNVRLFARGQDLLGPVHADLGY